MRLSHQAGLMLVVRYPEDAFFQVEIDDIVSCTCMTPTLLHLLCSHVITACRKHHVLHEGSNYMSPYYSLSAKEKT
jgi:hypothetical protein